MFAEFGPAPLCLELDFDSFDGPSHWVAKFRRMSGWMLVAKATIQSEYDSLTAKLVAACDEQENPIPAFKALNLLHCDWINPTYCDELPPDVLDDLICEQEGELVRRWHREKNAGLAEAFEAQEQRIADLEGRVRSAVRGNERRIAELRQRRRHPDATPEMRQAMAAIIGDLTEENDELVAEMATTREAIRVQAEQAEEALWSREDLLVEVAPLHLIRWSALKASRNDPPHYQRPRRVQFVPASGRTGLEDPGKEELWAAVFRAEKAKMDAERFAVKRAVEDLSTNANLDKVAEIEIDLALPTTHEQQSGSEEIIPNQSHHDEKSFDDCALHSADLIMVRRRLKHHTVDSPKRRALVELLAMAEAATASSEIPALASHDVCEVSREIASDQKRSPPTVQNALSALAAAQARYYGRK